MNFKHFFTLIFFGLSMLAVAQTTFEKRYYSGSGGSASYGITKTLDGRYVLSGYNKASTANRDWNLVKVDSLGNLVSSWQYDFGGDEGQECYVKATADSGFVVYGSTASGLASIMKLDKSGTAVWAKSFTGSTGPVRDVVQLPNGQYLVSYPKGVGFGFAKMSASGTIVWSRVSVGGVTGKILHTSDDYYVVSGILSTGNPAIVKFDTTGNALWARNFYDNAYSYSNGGNISVCQTTDLGFVIAFYDNSGNGGHAIKMDANGNKVWYYWATTSYNFVQSDVVALPNNESGFFIRDFGSGTHTLKFNKVSADGSTMTSRIIATNTSAYQVGSVYRKPDGSLPAGMVFCTGTYDSGAGLKEMELIKLEASLKGCSSVSFAPTAQSNYNCTQNNTGTMATTVPAMATLSPVFSTASVTTVPVCSFSPLAITASASSASNLCYGQCAGTATVMPTGGQSPYTYLWSPGAQTTAAISGLCAGAYTVVVTDANSSSLTTSISITTPTALTCTISTAGNSATANPAGGSNPYTFLWNDASAQTTQTATGLPNGTYSCTVTDANGCTVVNSIVIVNTGDEDELSQGSITIYPNPSSGEFTIVGLGIGGSSVNILDVLGNQVCQTTVNSKEEILHLNLPNGIYFLQIKIGEVMKTEKVVVGK